MRRCLNCMEEYPDSYEACPHCGFVDGVTQNGGINLPPGTILEGRYIVGTILKTRETDVFYIGWDALFDRKVQIQEYFPKYCATRSGQPQVIVDDLQKALFKAGLEMFAGQSRQMIRLYKEEDVITYHACFMENGTAYAILDYQPYQTLEDLLKEQSLREREAEKWLYAAADAVQKVHRLGISHRQIGPDAFWIRPGGGVILKDLGVTRYVCEEPGLAQGQAGYGADVYELAKMFCRMILGQEIGDAKTLEAELLKKQVSLKKTMADALKAALRHQTGSVEQFCQELRGVSLLARGSRRNKGTGKSLRLPRWLLASAAVLLIGGLSFTGLVVGGVITPRFVALEKSTLEADTARVPNVVNKNADEAEALLKAENLRMNRDTMVFSSEIPEGMVSYQDMTAGSVVQVNTEVVVEISMGKEKAEFPSLVGRPKKEALDELKQKGFLNIRLVDGEEKGVLGTVLKASHKANDRVELDQEIVLTICVKEAYGGDPNIQVKVPDVAGKQREEAERLLTAEDFWVNWVEETSDELEGTVLGQDPAAGKDANKGSFVTVRVSNGAAKIYMKNVQLMSVDEARADIEELGLTIESVTEEYSDSVAAGKVISQSIAQDAEVKKGDKVYLIISKGPDPAKQQAGGGQQQQAQPTTADPAAVEAARRQQEEAARRQQEQAEAAAAAQRQAEEAAAAQRAAEEAAAAQRASEEAAAQRTAEDAAAAQDGAADQPAPATGTGDGEQAGDTNKADSDQQVEGEPQRIDEPNPESSKEEGGPVGVYHIGGTDADQGP